MGSDDKYQELLAEGLLYESKEDWHKAAGAYREAMALDPDEPEAYFTLGNALFNSGQFVEAAQQYLEAKERFQPVGSEGWVEVTAEGAGSSDCLAPLKEPPRPTSRWVGEIVDATVSNSRAALLPGGPSDDDHGGEATC